jgi:glycosyltransferase involved in cell wall biosynthesis
MRLLFVHNTAWCFVAHRFAVALAAREAGFDVHVAAPEHEAAAVIRSAGFTFHPIELSRQGVHPWEEVQTVRQLVHLYRRLRPDVVHHITIKPAIYGGVAARIAGVPSVVHSISGLGYAFLAEGWKGWALRSAVLAGFRLALSHPNQTVIFENPDDRSAFLRFGLVRARDAVVIRGVGVDESRFFPPRRRAADRPLVLLAARMLWDKGIGEFVHAARRLREEQVDARFVLAGGVDPGNPAAISESQLDAWNEEGVVEWWGHLQDMPGAYAAADVACLPSYREGLPTALLEAAACALPLVATDVPGCREVVVAGDNGLLVPAGDADALAEALRTVIVDPALRGAMGRRGRERVLDGFTNSVVAAATVKVYRERLAAAQRAEPRRRAPSPAARTRSKEIAGPSALERRVV